MRFERAVEAVRSRRFKAVYLLVGRFGRDLFAEFCMIIGLRISRRPASVRGVALAGAVPSLRVRIYMSRACIGRRPRLTFRRLNVVRP